MPQINGVSHPRTEHEPLEHSSASAVTNPLSSARTGWDFSKVRTFSASETNQLRPSGSQSSAFARNQSNAPAVSENTASDLPGPVQDVLRSPGEPLAPATRSHFESVLGHDFSRVRIHTDDQAVKSTGAIGALAYTAGNHIVLGSQPSLPGTVRSNRLIAHELTHVVQQESAGDRMPTRIGRPGDSFEAEANAVADGIQSHARFGSPDIAMRTSQPVVQRVLPAAAEVLEIVLTATITLQEQYALSQGKLISVSGTASRKGDPPQPKDRDNKARVITIDAIHPLRPNIHCYFDVRWESNDFGEIGAAYVEVAPNHTEFSHSSLNVEFKPLDNLPNKDQDIRAWPMQWIYTGNFDPVGAGDYDFQGKFEIDAFGGFRVPEHVVTDNSLGFGGDPGRKIIRSGPNHPTKIVPLPPNTKVTTQAKPQKAPPPQK
ncbi:MAG TPA: DUF4157 domain-containing protein [Candidatus Angelobacter sp.]